MAPASKRKIRARLANSAPKRARVPAGGGGKAGGDEAVGRYIRALGESAVVGKEVEDVEAVVVEGKTMKGEEEGKDEEEGDEDVDVDDGILVAVDSSSGESASSDIGSDSGSEGDSEGDSPAVTAVPAAKLAGGLSAAAAADLPNVHVTVVLESANLEAVKLPGAKGGHALLSSEEHGTLLRKMKRDPNDARPDITHQCLLALMDSPLNKAGKLSVYVRTKRNALIKVHPQTRIPRTIRRFSGLMVELIQKLKVRSTNGTEPLLQVVRNPVVSHLPMGQRRVACTYNCERIVDVREHAKDAVEKVLDERVVAEKAREERIGEDERQDEEVKDKGEPVQILYVVGAMAHGKVDVDYTDEEICISEYPLSAATVCSRITFTYECMMGIL